MLFCCLIEMTSFPLPLTQSVVRGHFNLFNFRTKFLRLVLRFWISTLAPNKNDTKCFPYMLLISYIERWKERKTNDLKFSNLLTQSSVASQSPIKSQIMPLITMSQHANTFLFLRRFTFYFQWGTTTNIDCMRLKSQWSDCRICLEFYTTESVQNSVL